jgi:TRAP-type mannitol/chloroaromatic compound transport system permease large subunit
MPGGALGFLIVVNLLVFVLGMFIDFFEIAFIVIPMLAPVAEKILPALLPEGTPQNWVLIWFGVIIAMNLQTSFLTPPFGFALFYLRSVAARFDYKDRVTGATIPAVTTPQIYKGAVAFICIQVIMVAVVIVFPNLVIDTTPRAAIDLEKIQLEAAPRDGGTAPASGQEPSPGAGGEKAAEDPMEAIRRAVEQDKKK